MEKLENGGLLITKDKVKIKKFQIDKYMIPTKVAMLLSAGLSSCYQPFLNVFLISIGLAVRQAGFICGIKSLSSVIAGTIWGAVADYTDTRRLILCLLCIGAIISIFPMPWIPELVNARENNFFCKHQVINCSNETLLLNNGKKCNVWFATNNCNNCNASLPTNNYKNSNVSFPTYNFKNCNVWFTTNNCKNCNVLFTTNNCKNCNVSFTTNNCNNCNASLTTNNGKNCNLSFTTNNCKSCNVSSTTNNGKNCNVSLTSNNYKNCNVSFTPNNGNNCNVSFTTDKLFATMLSVTTIAALFEQPMSGFVDSIVMERVSNSKHKATYSHQRMFYAFGYALFSVLAGVTADHYKNPKLSSYTGIFFVFLATGLFLLPALYVMSSQTLSIKHKRDDEIKPAILKTVFRTYIKVNNILFLITLMLRGIADTTINSYLFVFITNELNGTKSIMGFSFAISCLSSSLTYPFAPRIMKFLRGPIPTLTFSIFGYFLRFLMMSYVQNPWLLLPIQTLTSITASIYFVSSVEYLNTISQKATATTMFGVAYGVHYGLGGFIGNIAGGILYGRYGGRELFRGLSIVCVGWCLMMLIYIILNRDIQKEEETQVHTTENASIMEITTEI